jgi:hypothetical protein
MSFYEFRFERFQVLHKRGIINDQDLVTFTILINGMDRGHGSVLFSVVSSNSVHSVDDIAADSWYRAYPAGNTLNMTSGWVTGPFEIAPDDDVVVIFTGTNTSDSSLSSLPHQDEDELELKILNQIAKKGVALVSGVGLGEELGNLFSEAFEKIFEDPVGDLIGYSRQGPCNGPVFSDAIRFTGHDLDHLDAQQLSPNPPATGSYRNPGVRFTRHYTDEATHDESICGHFADTDVTWALFRSPYVSVKDLIDWRFRGMSPSAGLRHLAQPPKFQPGSTISIKSLFGVLP